MTDQPVEPTRALLRSGRATTVLLLGVASFFFLACAGLGVLLAFLALVQAPAARREVEESHGTLSGLGAIKAGIAIALVTIAIFLVVVVGLLFLASGTGR